MPFFSQNCLENIRQKVSIVDVVSPYVQLKPSGHYLKSLSPFSHEKTPSFFVDPQRNIFKCFSTGYAGDMFRFLELKEQLTFSESVELLCERFNIPIEYKEGNDREVTRTLSSKRLLFSIYAKATEFFKQCFWADNALTEQVRDYWVHERHFNIETARVFNVGFAPTDLSALYRFLIQAGYDRTSLVESGLFYRPKNSVSGLISRYQGRLILPIEDIQGRTIAFSGRKLPFVQLPNDPTQEAKYVNSPETLIFVKGHELFNLNRARQNLNDEVGVFMVEGPLDVVRCWECGLKTAVAPQGTGITEDQLKLLMRYDIPITGMFDGDSAGIKAGIRLMTLGIPLALKLRYCLLGNNEDPDTTFYKNPDGCSTLLKKSLSPVEFFVEIFKNAGYDAENVQGHVLQHMLPIINRCESAVLRFELLRSLSQAFSIPMQVLEEELLHMAKKGTLATEVSKSSEKVKTAAVLGDTLERGVLLFMFHAPQLTPLILKHLCLDWIDTEQCSGRLLMKILNEFSENGIEELSDRSVFQLDTSEENLWGRLLAEEFDSENLVGRLSEILQQMYRKYLKKLISAIDKKLIKGSNISTELLQKLQMDRFLYKKALANVASSICLTEQQ